MALLVVARQELAQVSEAQFASWDKILSTRHYSLGHSERVETLVRGVSFEGRQAIVSQLGHSEGLVVMADIMNEYDSYAQAVYTADMTLIGYVARKTAPAFPNKICFGKVVSMGMAREAGLMGTTVALFHKSHGLWLDLLPEEWQEAADLEQLLSPEHWQEAESEVLRCSHNRCSITGMPAAKLPLHVVPQWAFDDKRKQVYLAGLLAVCEPILELKQQLAEAGQELLAREDVQNALEQRAEAHETLKAVVMTNQQRKLSDPDAAIWDTETCRLAAKAAGVRKAARRVIKTVAGTLPAEQQQAIGHLAELMAWHPRDALLYLLHAVQRREQLQQGWALREPSWGQVQQLLWRTQPVERLEHSTHCVLLGVSAGGKLCGPV